MKSAPRRDAGVRWRSGSVPEKATTRIGARSGALDHTASLRRARGWTLRPCFVWQPEGCNQAIEATGIFNTQRLATLFDGISRHSPEGINFKTRSEDVGWKQAVNERDRGTYDWTQDRPLNKPL